MRTTDAARRQGVDRALIQIIISECVRRGVSGLNLEAGVEKFFAPTRALYAGLGFKECAPFADYALDPNSVYMTLRIDGQG